MFAYAGGWLRPDALTPSRFADRFEQVYRRHDGFRRNHAKGLSASGTFTSNGAGAAVCRAAVFASGTVPVIGRFSLSGGIPDQADRTDTVRGLALAFLLPSGQQWRTAMINLPVFPDSTPRGSDDGLRFAIFYTKVHDRVLRPLLAPDQPQTPPPIRKALRTIDIHITEPSTGLAYCQRRPENSRQLSKT